MTAASRGVGANQEGVRRHNLGTLLRHVHDAGEISRAELTGRMGLNRSTIAGLVTELDTLGLISASFGQWQFGQREWFPNADTPAWDKAMVGGMVVAQGTPEEIAKAEASHTGRFLRDVLKRGRA